MKISLRLRLVAYGVLGGLYLVVFVAGTAFVALPVLEDVDRALAPLQHVFREIEERQRHVLSDIAALDSLVDQPGAPALHPALSSGDRSHRASPSLLARYSRELSVDAARRLAVVEDALAGIESAVSEAAAIYELGNIAGARAALARIRDAEDEVQKGVTEAMVVALNTGLAARERFQDSVQKLWVFASVRLIGGLLLLVLIAVDASRHFLRPIAALEAGMRRIADGDWSRPVAVPHQDEFGQLARQFNALTETLEQRAGQHAQLATAGELLAGVAHELNNPLQAIRGIAELKSAETGAGDWATVLAEARRASKVARELERFVRPARRMVERVALNDVVRGALGLIGFQYRADGIVIEMDLGGRLPDVWADPHELVQVLVNLLGNAHAALARNTGPRTVLVRTWADDSHVWCRIRDNGPGIPEDVRGRIFSPFFSTREGGVGLGLTVSRNMVRTAGGELVLDPGPSGGGGGASLTFWLPPAPAETVSGGNGAAPVAGGARPQGSLRDRVIVVADDEDAIRNVLERFLRREGSRVIAAPGGREVLAIIRAEPVDAVVLDMRMPDLDGARVYQALQAERADVASRTVFLSGDITGVAEELGVPDHRVLLKPIELADLKRVLLRLIDGA